MDRDNDSKKDVNHLPIPKERYRDGRKKFKDQFQITMTEFDPDEWDDWMDEELFEQFEPIQKNKRKR